MGAIAFRVRIIREVERIVPDADPRNRLADYRSRLLRARRKGRLTDERCRELYGKRKAELLGPT